MFSVSNDGQRGFIHQMGDVIEHVFRPTAKKQEMLLQQIIMKLDRENSNQETKKINGRKYSTDIRRVICQMKAYRMIPVRNTIAKIKTNIQ
jgi:hypothetical protein